MRCENEDYMSSFLCENFPRWKWLHTPIEYAVDICKIYICISIFHITYMSERPATAEKLKQKGWFVTDH